jgi:hypothetical protein
MRIHHFFCGLHMLTKCAGNGVTSAPSTGSSSHPQTALAAERARFDQIMLAVNESMLQTSKSGLVYVGDRQYGKLQSRMDHLYAHV